MNEFEEKIPETVTDITGAVLTPGNPEKCQGNGEHKDFECCCDECDWFFFVFPNITAYNNHFEAGVFNINRYKE